MAAKSTKPVHGVGSIETEQGYQFIAVNASHICVQNVQSYNFKRLPADYWLYLTINIA